MRGTLHVSLENFRQENLRSVYHLIGGGVEVMQDLNQLLEYLRARSIWTPPLGSKDLESAAVSSSFSSGRVAHRKLG